MFTFTPKANPPFFTWLFEQDVMSFMGVPNPTLPLDDAEAAAIAMISPSQQSSDDASNPATELSQHASDCGDRCEPFKSCSPRIPARSCGRCGWKPAQ